MELEKTELIEKIKKAKTSWKTSFMVFVYAAIFLVCMTLQTLVLLGVKLDWSWSHFINSKVVLPIDNMSFLWTIISSAYIGVDRAAYCVKSAEMPTGNSDIGNPKTLRIVIALSIIFFFTAIGGNILTDANFDLVSLSTSLGVSISLYITGQKAITLCKNVDGKISISPNEK